MRLLDKAAIALDESGGLEVYSLTIDHSSRKTWDKTLLVYGPAHLVSEVTKSTTSESISCCISCYAFGSFGQFQANQTISKVNMASTAAYIL